MPDTPVLTLTSSFETGSVKSSALAPEQAIALFDKLADRTDLAWGYPAQGCHARAHILCHDLAEMGLSPKKAWASDTLYDRLYLKPPEGELMEWNWHAAPVLAVKMPDGKVQDMVFDPVFFDGPVLLAEWGKLIHAKPENVEIVTPGDFPAGFKSEYVPSEKGPFYNLRGTKEAYTADAHAKKELENYLPLQKIPRTVFQSTFRQMLPEAPTRGATWISVPLQAVSVNRPKNPSA